MISEMNWVDEPIKVTRSHIRRGEQADCDRCPIALVMREHTGDRAVVGSGVIALGDLPRQDVWWQGPKLRDWRSEFDVGGRMPPITLRADRETRTIEIDEVPE